MPTAPDAILPTGLPTSPTAPVSVAGTGAISAPGAPVNTAGAGTISAPEAPVNAAGAGTISAPEAPGPLIAGAGLGVTVVGIVSPAGANGYYAPAGLRAGRRMYQRGTMVLSVPDGVGYWMFRTEVYQEGPGLLVAPRFQQAGGDGTEEPWAVEFTTGALSGVGTPAVFQGGVMDAPYEVIPGPLFIPEEVVAPVEVMPDYGADAPEGPEEVMPDYGELAPGAPVAVMPIWPTNLPAEGLYNSDNTILRNTNETPLQGTRAV